MKAVLSTIAGGPETLTLGDVPVPPLGPRRVCIANKACSINYPEVLVIQDLYQTKSARPFTPGTDIAGVVEAIGEGVRNVRAGDRVLALSRFGGLAERVVVEEQRCIKIPQSLPFDIAAALPTTYGTSLYALNQRAQLKSGETLLVLGAAGGVGLAAVELGKAAGARVIAAASSAAKVAIARKQGADVGVVYTPGPLDKAQARALADEFKSACGPNGADVVYDAVGGDYAIPEAYREGTFRYELPLPDGKWNVTLHMFEPQQGKVGTRTFDVAAGAKVALHDFNPGAAAGGALKAVTRTFPVRVNHGRLDLEFTPKGGDAVVSAIVVSR
jgi:NADPH:quinone reductase-like Zn-dependent oxidoreductase